MSMLHLDEETSTQSQEFRPGEPAVPQAQMIRLASVSTVSLADVGGLKEELRRLRESIELPLKYSDVLRKKGIRPARLVVVHGPAGCGKSLLLKAFAADAGLRMFVVRWSQLVARNDDDSRRLLADTMARARANMPSLIMIDDLEFAGFGFGEVGDLSRKKSAQIVEAIDSLSNNENVTVIVVSSGPDNIDPALRKPGSISEEIEFHLPLTADRKAILDVVTRGQALQGVDLMKIAAATDGYSGADLALLVKNAFRAAFRRTVPGSSVVMPAALEKVTLTEADFRNALQETGRKAKQAETRGEVL